MKNRTLFPSIFLLSGLVFFTQCTDNRTEKKIQTSSLASSALGAETAANMYGGYSTQEELGEHLVMIAGCHDCHTPKKMGEHGPELDMDLALSGHPAKMPPPPVNRKEMESKGIAATQTLTAWVGPWGISYAANITSDATGIGNWQENNFITAIREGKHKGLQNGRRILPPMPWEMFRYMTDDELKAVFAYLKSTKPIKNIVPAPEPPVTAPQTTKK